MADPYKGRVRTALEGIRALNDTSSPIASDPERAPSPKGYEGRAKSALGGIRALQEEQRAARELASQQPPADPMPAPAAPPPEQGSFFDLDMGRAIAESPFFRSAVQASTALAGHEQGDKETTLRGHLEEVGRGIPRGAANLYGTGVRGIAALKHGILQQGQKRGQEQVAQIATGLQGWNTLTPEQREELRFTMRIATGVPADVREELARGFAQAEQSGTYQPGDQITGFLENPPIPPLTEDPLFEVGTGITDRAGELFPRRPGYEDSTGGNIGEGLGSVGAGVVASATLGPAAAGGLFAGAGTGEAVDRAIADGATEDEIIEAARLGLIPGLTDSVPVETLLGRIPIPGVGRIKLPEGALGDALEKVSDIGTQAFIEGVQEGGQEFLQNLIAREVYKPEQELLEGVPGASGEGFTVGGIVAGIRELMFPGRQRGKVEIIPEGAEDQAAPAPEAEAEPVSEAAAQPNAKTPAETQPEEVPAAEVAAPAGDDVIPEPGAGPETEPEADGGQLRAGTRVRFTYGGEAMEGEIAEVYEVEDADGGEPETGVRIKTSEGVVDDFASGLEIEPLTGTRKAPATAETREDIAAAEAKVAAEPTEAQKEAGNYAKGHVKVQGLDVTIENAKGQVRTGRDADGNEWSVDMPAAYGYVKRTTGADGEQVDVYLGDEPQADTVFVIDQTDADTMVFDEHKVMVGFPDADAARATYEAGFSDGRGADRLGGMTAMSMDEFKGWLKKGDTRGSLQDVATDADEAVSVRVTREGPWDFNETYPAPDPERLRALNDQGRRVFDHYPPGADEVVASIDEGLNELVIANRDLREYSDELARARAGAKPPKRKKREDWIAELENDVANARQTIDDVRAAHADIFGESTASRILGESRYRAVQEAKTTATQRVRPGEREDDAPAQAPEKSAPTSIGENAQGFPIFQDENGARSYVQGDVMVHEPVASWVRNPRTDDRFMTEQERSEVRKTQVKEVEPAPKQTPKEEKKKASVLRPFKLADQLEAKNKKALAQYRGTNAGDVIGELDNMARIAADQMRRDGVSQEEFDRQVSDESGDTGQNAWLIRQARAAADAVLDAARAAKSGDLPVPSRDEETGEYDYDGSPISDAMELLDTALSMSLPIDTVETDGGYDPDAVTDPMPDEDIFPALKKTITITGKAKSGPFIGYEEAQDIVEGWKAAARADGEQNDNSKKVIISLFDYTGAWSQPWVDAGYEVLRHDVKTGGDVLTDTLLFDRIEEYRQAGMTIYGVMSACPCTTFTGAGARWWQDLHDKESPEAVEKVFGRNAVLSGAKSPLEYNVMLYEATRDVIRAAKPEKFHALENPIGRIQAATGLGKPAMRFHPSNFGDPYTKQTQLFGTMDTDLPLANVDPVEGSKIQSKLRGNNPLEKEARSTTPDGFAYAFYMAQREAQAQAVDAPAAAAAAPEQESADRVLVDALKPVIVKASKPITQRQLSALAKDAYGGTVAQGAYDPRRAYDALEVAVNELFAEQRLAPMGDAARTARDIRSIEAVLNKLPNQSRRTGSTDAFQQFSTPPHYAFIANWLANIRPGDQMLEPSAGNGGLAVFAHNSGADVVANELDPQRRANLEMQGFRVFGEDAEQIDNILPDDVAPDVVVMNPPFSNAGARGVKRDQSISTRHIQQALNRLRDGGRLVAIVGQGFGQSGKTKAGLEKIGKNNAVRASIAVDGKVYRKYGTAFGTRIIVIDKVAPDGKPTETHAVEVFDAPTLEALEGIRNDRTYPRERAGDEPAGRTDDAGRRDDAGRNRPVRDRADEVGAGKPDRRLEDQPSGRPSADDGTASRKAAGRSDEVSDGGRADRSEPRGDGTRDRSGASAEPSAQSDGRDGRGVSPGGPGALKVKTRRKAQTGKTLGDGLYDAYVPQTMQIEGAQQHSTPLVQSAAMASVEPPKPTYQPALPESIAADGVLSEAQLEAVVYAGQAHAQTAKMWVGGDLGEQEVTQRRGFFIGDGTGVGKGREISGILLDNWNQGRRKAVWISEKGPLFNDAKRDFGDVGGPVDALFDMGKVKADAVLDAAEGIAFTTYDRLKMAPQGKQSRLDQLVNWLGEDFDGVIAFDEAHNMGNAVTIKGKRGQRKASAKAMAGVELQRRLPDARVVYVSATGATEVENLSYADRLRLWGPGTAFASREKFISQISQGGLAAMELVARDLKAMGLYVARSLSFDGVGYTRVEHSLTDNQRAMYDTLARAWQTVLQNIDAALELTGGNENANAKSAAYSAFWGGHQRFFNQVLTSMQMPTVLRAMEKDLANGMSPVLQLVNTNEAAQERAIAGMAEDATLEDLDLTPRDQLMQLVEKSFPTTQHEEYFDDDGNKRSRPVLDSKDNPVESREAVQLREDLLAEIGMVRVPDGPLEMILNKFGVDQVAEVTGRTRRVVEVKGRRKLERRGSQANVAEADDFMSGKKLSLIFSNAGGTGRSYHAALNAKNQRPRAHYLLQPGWSAAPAIQGFGRTHRTNQAQPPEYRLVSTDAKGQKRFISSIARRLDQLGALTRGQRQTGGQGMFSASDNLESDYARLAVTGLVSEIAMGRLADEGLPRDIILNDMGLKVIDDDTGALVTSKIPSVPTFLNRLLSLELDKQDLMFVAFEKRLDDTIERAREEGSFDVGVEVLRGETMTKKSDKVIVTDPETGAETRYVVVDRGQKANIRQWADVKVGAQPDGQYKVERYVRNVRSGRVYALTDWRAATEDNGQITPRYRLYSPTAQRAVPQSDFTSWQNKYEEISAAEAKVAWEKEVGDTPAIIHSDVHLITGTILPVWDRLKDSSTFVYRVPLDSGETILGREIPGEVLHATLDALGATAEAPKMSATEVVDAVLQGGARVRLANGYELSRRALGGEPRVRVGNVDMTDFHALRSQGLQFERVGYESMLFLPENDTGMGWLEQLLERVPVASVVKAGQDQFSVPPEVEPDLTVADRKVALADLRKQLKAYGLQDQLAVRVVDAIEQTGNGAETPAQGRYFERLIDVARNAADPSWVLDHEIIHGLRDIRVLRPQEWVALYRAATADKALMASIRDRYAGRGLNEDQMVEEAVADMFATWRAGQREHRGIIKRAMERIRNFIEALGQALAGNGFTTAEDVFRGIESGEVGARAAAGPSSDARYSVPPNDEPAPKGAFESLLGMSDAKPNPEEVLERVRADRATIAEAFRGVKPDDGVRVIRPKKAGDVPFWKRIIYTPEKIFSEHSPVFYRVWKRAVDAMDGASRMTRELQRDVSELTAGLDEEQTLDLSTLLFKGDALETEFTKEDLDRGFVGGETATDEGGKTIDNVAERREWLVEEGRTIDPKVRDAYLGMRRFMKKLGRMTDMHERKMLPTLRRRKLQLIRRLADMRQMEVDAFRKLVNEMLNLRSKIRRGETQGDESLQAMQERVREAEARVLGTMMRSGEIEDGDFVEAYTELLAIESRLQKTSVQTRKGYFPHKFFGSFMVVRRYEMSSEGLPADVLENMEAISADLLPVKVREDLGLVSGESVSFHLEDAPYDPDAEAEGTAVGTEGGRPQKVVLSKLITNPKDGFFQTIDDAIRAANAYVRGAPGADLTVKPVEFSFPEAQATQLTDAAYHRFVGNVSNLLGVSYDDAMGITRESARKRFRRRIAGFKQFRKGIAGYSKEFEKVIDAHLGQTVRYITMDELKYISINAIEKEGLSPNRSSVQERPVLAAIVNNWLRDLNGQKQPLESQIDELFDKPWAKPLNIGLGAGLTSFLAAGGVSASIGVAGLTGAAVPVLVGSYVGYRFYKATSQGSAFPTRAITGAMLNDMAHLKLGAFFNLFSPLVNTTQLIINAYPVLGEKYLAAGISRYTAAMTLGRNVEKNREAAKAKGEIYRPTQAERDFLLLRRANVDTAFKYSEQSPNLFERESSLSKLSLFWFNQAENLNRGSTFLGAYARAEGSGFTPGRAFRSANDTMRRTQFDYSNANKPEVLRNVLARVPLQFKNYMTQQIAFIMGLDAKELPRFTMAVVLMAGALGLPFLDLLDILTGWIFGEDKSALVLAKEEILRQHAAGESSGTAADIVARGLPALVGVDLVSRVGMGEKFLPTELRDFKGPWWSTIENAITFGGENATVVDQVRNLSAGLGAPLKSIEAAANGLPLVETLVTDPAKVAAALQDDVYEFRSPWQRGRLEYQPTLEELLLKSVGGSPIYESNQRLLRDVAYAKKEGYAARRKKLTDDIVRAIRAGDTEALEEARQRAIESRITLTNRVIRNALVQADRPRLERVMRNLPKDLRPDFFPYAQAIDRGREPPEQE